MSAVLLGQPSREHGQLIFLFLREWVGPLQAVQAFVRLQSRAKSPPKCMRFFRHYTLLWFFWPVFGSSPPPGQGVANLHPPEKSASDRLH